MANNNSKVNNNNVQLSTSKDQTSVHSWDDELPVPKLTFPLASVTVFLLSILCFCNSYDGEFVFDDSEAILGNKDLLPTTSLSDVFQHDFWGRKLASETSHKSYRPLTVLTFRMNYYLAEGYHPMGFHIINILLHACVSVLILHIFSILFTGHYSSTSSFNSPKAALLCAVIFAVHPVHTESVAGIVGRADLLCAFLFLLSFIFYAKSCTNAVSGISYRPENLSIFWLLLAITFSALSTFCKEQGITVIGLCSAFDIIMVCRIDILSLFKIRSSSCNNISNNNVIKQQFKPWLKYLLFRQFCLLLSGVLLLMLRWRVMGSATPTFQIHDNPHSFVDGAIFRAINYIYLYAINMWILINPVWLCFDWSMGCVPVIISFTDYRVYIAATFLAVLILSLLYSVKDNSKHQRLLILSLVFLIVPFLPGSNIFFRVGFVIAERVLYLSSTGMCMLITYSIISLAKKTEKKMVIQIGLILFITLYTSRSIQRSEEWRSEASLFQSGEKVCPLNAKVHYNIGKLDADKGNNTQAIYRYRLAIKLSPDYDQAMNNLANILKDKGELAEAEELLTKAVTIRPEFAAAWMNLGIVQAQLKKSGLAEKSYLQALRHRRKYPDCYYNLGNLYLELKQHQAAIQAWRNATILKPTHVNAWTNTLILLDNIGELKLAENISKEALKVLPGEHQVLFNVANIYGKLEKYTESEQFFLMALKEDPMNAKYHLNIGVLYHRWGKYDQAEQAYQKALQLNPSNKVTLDNIAMLQRQRNK